MFLPGTWIAIIDDDESTRRALARIFHAHYLSASAFSSWAALQPIMDTSPPACMMLDIFMPAPNGFEILALLRNQARCTPVIFMSATDNPEIEDQARAIGTFLRKPFSEGPLLASLHTAISNQSPAGRLADGPPIDRQGFQFPDTAGWKLHHHLHP